MNNIGNHLKTKNMLQPKIQKEDKNQQNLDRRKNKKILVIVSKTEQEISKEEEDKSKKRIINSLKMIKITWLSIKQTKYKRQIKQ